MFRPTLTFHVVPAGLSQLDEGQVVSRNTGALPGVCYASSHRAEALSDALICLTSVCLSDVCLSVAYIGPNSRTEA